MSSGRPLVVVAPTAPQHQLSAVMVCWKERAETARALAVSMPLLKSAKRVLFVSISEGQQECARGLQDLDADGRLIARDGHSVSKQLLDIAKACSADLMVMGAYGHMRARELVFGGCTRDMLANADVPTLFMH